MSVINNLNNDNKDDELKWLKGSCHCGAVTFEVFVKEPIDVYNAIVAFVDETEPSFCSEASTF